MLALAAVPWSAASAPTPRPFALVARLPPCPASALFGVTTGVNGAAGAAIYDVALINTSRHTCALRGRPSWIDGVTGSGRLESIVVGRLSGGSAWVGDQPAVLVPGGGGEFALAVPVVCPTTATDRHYASLRIGLTPRGRGVPVRVRGAGPSSGITVGCGVAVSRYARLEAPAWPGPPSAEPGLYALRVGVPPSFRLSPGQRRLTFTVALQNPTTHPLRFGRCPSYTESVLVERERGIRPLAARRIAQRSYRLNCRAGGAGSVPAHGTVRYAMELLLGSQPSMETGATLLWRLNLTDGTGPEGTSNWCAACAPSRSGQRPRRR